MIYVHSVLTLVHIVVLDFNNYGIADGTLHPSGSCMMATIYSTEMEGPCNIQ